MKKNQLRVVLVIFLFIIAIVNVNKRKSKTELSALALENIEALAEGEGAPGATCYSTYHNCWFWNCDNIFNCNKRCTTVRSDDYQDEGKC